MAASCLFGGCLWLRLTPDLVSFCWVVLLLILGWSVKCLSKSRMGKSRSEISKPKEKKVPSNSYWDEAVARWSRVCELGMEAALREAGCSEKESDAIVHHISSKESFDLEYLKGHRRPVRAPLLATIGRGSTPVKRLWSRYTDYSRIPWNEDEVAALCVNLSFNANIVDLQLTSIRKFATWKECTLLGQALARNSSVINLNLSRVGMSSDSVRCLLDGLQSNESLEALHLDNNGLLDEGIRSVAEFLSNNTTLKVLHLEETYASQEGANHLSWALETNTTCKTLGFGLNYVGTAGSTRLLRPLSLDILNDYRPQNTTLEGLHLAHGKSEHVESITHLIRTNKFLRTLGLRFSRFSSTNWYCQIFPALNDNDTLTELILEDNVLMAGLFDLIQNGGTGLEKVTIEGSRDKLIQGRVDEELRISKEYRSQLSDQPQTESLVASYCADTSLQGKQKFSIMKRIQKGSSLAHSKMGGKNRIPVPFL